MESACRFLQYWAGFVLVITLCNYCSIIHAVIPKPCVHNVTGSHVCCPVSKHSHEVCGGPERGFCGKVDVHRQKIAEPFMVDDRVHWPLRFFTHLCHCHGKFFGITCDECWFGWEGKHCDKRAPTRVRKNWVHMSHKEKMEFLKVMQLSYKTESDFMIMKEQDNWRADPLKEPIFLTANVHYFMVFLHRFASRTTLYDSKYMCQKYGILDYNHDGAAFVTWHRYFMLYWERTLQELASKHYGIEEFNFPYWSWVDTTECEICSNDMAGAEGEVDKYGLRLHPESIFSNWTEYCREPTNTPICYGCHYNLPFGIITRRWNNKIMPTTEDLDFVMSQGNFFVEGEKDGEPCQSFHMAVEGFCGEPGVNNTRLYMHNFVHNSFDGSMCCSASATNDPLFIVHHIEVDRMVEAWLLDNKPKLEDYPNDNVRPGHCRECNMVGFFPLLRHSDIFPHSAKEFGYTYDSFEFGKKGRRYGDGTPAHERFPHYSNARKRQIHGDIHYDPPSHDQHDQDGSFDETNGVGSSPNSDATKSEAVGSVDSTVVVDGAGHKTGGDTYEKKSLSDPEISYDASSNVGGSSSSGKSH